MSGSPNEPRDDLWGRELDEATPTDLSQIKGQVSPKLILEVDEDDDGDIDRRIEYDPLVVTRLGGTLPFNTESTQLQCSESVTENNGDQNIRLVMESVCNYSQLQKLEEMRETEGNLKLVSRAYTGYITFDELKFDRVTDANGSIDAEGGNNDQPHFKLQLQSKEITEPEQEESGENGGERDT